MKKGKVKNFTIGRKMKMIIAGVLAIIFTASAIWPGGVLWILLHPEKDQDASRASEQEMTDSVSEIVPVIQTDTNADINPEPTASMFAQLLQKSQIAAEEGNYTQALNLAEECLKNAETEDERLLALAQKGNMFFALEYYAAAEECFRSLLSADSADKSFSPGAVYDMLARCTLLQDKPDEAVDYCTAGIDISEEQDEILPGLYALRGTAYMSGGNFSAAINDFQKALDLDYSDPELLEEEIARCQELLENPELASLAFAGGDASAAELEAVSAYLSGNYSKAADCYEQLLGKGGSYSDAQLYSNIAKCRILLSQYDRAVDNCRKGIALGSTSENGTLYALLGTAYMAKGDNLSAADSFENALNHGYSDRAQLLSQAASCYYFAGRYSDCIRCCDSMPEGAGPNETTLWSALSRYAIGNYTAAVPLLEQSIGLQQNYCETDELYRILSQCHFMIGNHSAAVNAATLGIEESEGKSAPDMGLRAELYALRGTAKYSAGQTDSALKDFESAQACGINGIYDIYRQCALWEFQRGDYSKTISAGELALSSGEGTSDLFFVMGLSYFSLENYSSAKEMLRKCEALSPGTDNLYFYLGVCSFSVNDYQDAIDLFTRSIERAESLSQRSMYNRGLCYLQLEDYQSGKEDVQAAAEQTADPSVSKDATELLNSLKELFD